MNEHLALRGREIGVLAGFAVTAFLLLRLLLFHLEPIANPDGTEYTYIGIQVVSGDPGFFDIRGYHFYRDKPIYPLLIGLANLVVRDHHDPGHAPAPRDQTRRRLPGGRRS